MAELYNLKDDPQEHTNLVGKKTLNFSILYFVHRSITYDYSNLKLITGLYSFTRIFPIPVSLFHTLKSEKFSDFDLF